MPGWADAKPQAEEEKEQKDYPCNDRKHGECQQYIRMDVLLHPSGRLGLSPKEEKSFISNNKSATMFDSWLDLFQVELHCDQTCSADPYNLGRDLWQARALP
jgi:hypothetical protein